MPTRKQRRRRQKDFRHDVRVFEVDDEGNEIPIAELRQKDEKPAKAAVKQQRGQARSAKGRPIKEASPPSWNRAIKRGGLMGGVMLLFFLFVLKSGSIVQRVVIPVFYAAAFIPLTYLIDRTAYRSYLKRSGRSS